MFKSFINGCKSDAIKPIIDKETILDSISLAEFYAGQITRLLKLYEPGTAKISERNKVIIRTIVKLKNNVSGSMLPLKKIFEACNESLPEMIKITSCKSLGGILRKELYLETRESSGGVYYLVWDERKINKLFKEAFDSPILSEKCLVSTEAENNKIYEVEGMEIVNTCL